MTVLPMGIACTPQVWMDYITLIVGELEDKAKYIMIMDDLLIHSTKCGALVANRAAFAVNGQRNVSDSKPMWCIWELSLLFHRMMDVTDTLTTTMSPTQFIFQYHRLMELLVCGKQDTSAELSMTAIEHL